MATHRLARLRAGLGFLFILIFPLFLATTALHYEANDLRLYQQGFKKYGVSQITGIDPQGLTQVAQGLINYFNSSQEPIQLVAVMKGQPTTLFNSREVAHLKDVKGLIQLVNRVQEVALGFLALYGAFLLIDRGTSWRQIAKEVLVGSGVTLALLLALAIGAVTNFDQLFLGFHLVSFSNDLWLLDPSRDRLIQLFPQGFFQDATLFVAGLTAVEAGVLGGLAGIYLLWSRKRGVSSGG